MFFEPSRQVHRGKPGGLLFGQSLGAARRATRLELVKVDAQVGFEFAVAVGEEFVQCCGHLPVARIGLGLPGGVGVWPIRAVGSARATTT